MAFARMDEANWAGVYDSQGKAVAAAAFRADSSSLQGWADSPLMRAIVASDGGHMMPSRGGVLVRRNGQVVGACGVGGRHERGGRGVRPGRGGGPGLAVLCAPQLRISADSFAP